MRNWGIRLLICGWLAIVRIISEPQEDYKEGLFAKEVFLFGGDIHIIKNKITYYARSCRIFTEAN